MAPAAWIFPRNLEIWKVWIPNRTLSEVDSRAVGKVGVARKFGARNRPFRQPILAVDVLWGSSRLVGGATPHPSNIAPPRHQRC